jgi:hypothetical protein
VQRAVKVYSEVEKITVNTDDCADNRPAALPSVSYLLKRVISVKYGNRQLRSEPNVSETYNTKRKLRMISEIKGRDDTSVTTGEHLTKGTRALKPIACSRATNAVEAARRMACALVKRTRADTLSHDAPVRVKCCWGDR